MGYEQIPAQGLYNPLYEHDSCGVGFVCHIKGKKSNSILRDGLKGLARMEHRGAVGSDPMTGDGAGVLIQIPHDFFKKITNEISIKLPKVGNYGSGLVFLPIDDKEQQTVKKDFEKIINEEGQKLLGWRDVPVDPSAIGKIAHSAMPFIAQIFIEKNSNLSDTLSFERKLYIIRKRMEKLMRDSLLEGKKYFYVPSLSTRTFSYRGMLMSNQVDKFFIDLADSDIKTAICMVHSRYSTNTFPTWDLAQPLRYLAHNGEINTLRGNINWNRARESLLSHEVWGDDIKKLLPITVDGMSDSATIDNVFELLALSGRSLPHAMMLLIPNAWEQNKLMDNKHREFYKYHRCLSEPWDGPASMSFTDGKKIGAILDRNGLRPSRFIVTKDDRVIMASEVGVLDIEPENIKLSGRLEPGKIFLIDTEEGRIVGDQEIKDSMANQSSYGEWLKNNLLELGNIKTKGETKTEKEPLMKLMQAFGYTREDLKVLIGPMVELKKGPIGSMGNDTPHACISSYSHSLYTYFKQIFAQVTNPAIDPIREELVMSLELFIGPEKNQLIETPEHARRLHINNPILTNNDLEKIRMLDEKGLKTKTISILFEPKGTKELTNALNRICDETEKAIKDGYTFVILSDRGVDKNNVALPALLSVGAIHQHLIRKALRTQIGIVLESAEPREIHHFNVLFGFGVDAVNPYLLYDVIEYMIDEGMLKTPVDEAKKNYIKALHKGMLKILSKIGISTLQSYKGAQIFEALGIHKSVIDRCFTNTASRIGGVGFDVIAKETIERHKQGFAERKPQTNYLKSGGLYQWKKDGETHLWNPESIAALQDAVWNNDFGRYKEFAELINNQTAQAVTLRGMLKFKKRKPIPIDEVEAKEEIFKRFVTGAMSFGSISKGAHETLAIAMNRLGGMSNTGEGGEDPARFMPLPNGDSRRSKIKQIASGRFGVTTNYLVNADELQIKIAQGAKPGEGGQLPGHKVSAIIAKTRHTTPGVTLISPPPHHDIYSIEDLAQLIFDLKNTNPLARISVKLVSEVGVGTIAAGVAKGHADMILISGGDGGTGATPLSSLKHAGLPWELGLSETHQTLVMNDLRSRVRLQTDGQLRTGRDVAIAALLGAEEYGFATSALITMGCTMLRHCQLNTCSMGIATQNDMLQSRFAGKPEYVTNYISFIVTELREIMAELGFRTIDEMIGRVDVLEVNENMLNWKTKDMDFSKILYKPDMPKDVGVYKTKTQVHKVGNVLDRKLIEICQSAILDEKPVKTELKIHNTDRSVGAMLSGELCKRHGDRTFVDETIHIKFNGEAGQSFGAFLTKGTTFELEGMSNDYIGKGLFGGRIIVYPYKNANYLPEENIIIGNTSFYGATAGEAFIRGKAGERFCIRNSGVNAVIEGVGDHGCEYMTGGRVVVIGTTGRNFAAGMSGGIAYVWDVNGDFKAKVNTSMIELEDLKDDDLFIIQDLLRKHLLHTYSTVAQKVLDNWHNEVKRFVKVMPTEYKRILETREWNKRTEVQSG